jgi:hypothetical protein
LFWYDALAVRRRIFSGGFRMRPSILITGLALAAVAVVNAADVGTRADADALERKIVGIATNGLAEKPAAKTTAVLEREVNAYLQAHSKEQMPQGVLDPRVSIQPDGRLTGTATVDLDAVRNSKERGVLSPWTLLRGTVPVEASGILRTENGVAAFTLEEASVGGVPVPKAVLQELVSYYSKGPNSKDGINFEQPFRLPAHIREIHTAMGQATVVQ